jgi:hypothetical protein
MPNVPTYYPLQTSRNLATLTLGLLFTGWFSPVPLRAQGNSGPNPPPNNETTNCPPVWGNWQVDPNNVPTITIAFAAPGDQCVQIPVGSTIGSLSVSAGSPKTTGGGKFQVDTSGCNNPNNPGTLSIDASSISVAWTASGCGASPGSGTGTTAKFTVNAVGSCTVAFTAQGTTSNPQSGPYISTAASQTFNVHLNNQSAGTPTPPAPANPFGLPDISGYKYDSGPQFYGWGVTVDTIITGSITGVTGNERYVADGNVQFTGCDAMLKKSFTGGSWEVTATFEYAGFTLSGKISGSQVSSTVFDLAATPYIRWYGQVYDQKVTPSSGTLVGNQSVTYTHNGDTGIPQNTPINTTISLNGDEFINSEVGSPCPVACCGS